MVCLVQGEEPAHDGARPQSKDQGTAACRRPASKGEAVYEGRQGGGRRTPTPEAGNQAREAAGRQARGAAKGGACPRKRDRNGGLRTRHFRRSCRTGRQQSDVLVLHSMTARLEGWVTSHSETRIGVGVGSYGITCLQ
ncbi:unnamed protein product [Ascophyllum nodosum]